MIKWIIKKLLNRRHIDWRLNNDTLRIDLHNGLILNIGEDGECLIQEERWVHK